MRSGDVALRLSIVFSLIGVIALLAGLYEIDRREKSSSETLAANVGEIEQRVQALANQVRVLSDQYTAQLSLTERQLQGLNNQIQALTHQYESRLKKLEDDLRALRSESAPARR
jgi:peptidoglycan hydrolase CwlO-like protein